MALTAEKFVLATIMSQLRLPIGVQYHDEHKERHFKISQVPSKIQKRIVCGSFVIHSHNGV